VREPGGATPSAAEVWGIPLENFEIVDAKSCNLVFSNTLTMVTAFPHVLLEITLGMQVHL